MKEFLIYTKNYTQAERTRRFLARHGVRSTVRRITGREGCTFALVVQGNKESVCALLKEVGVRCDIP